MAINKKVSIQMPMTTMPLHKVLAFLARKQRAAELKRLPFEIVVPDGYPIEHAAGLLFRLMRRGSGSSDFTVFLPKDKLDHSALARFRRMHNGVKFKVTSQ